MYCILIKIVLTTINKIVTLFLCVFQIHNYNKKKRPLPDLEIKHTEISETNYCIQYCTSDKDSEMVDCGLVCEGWGRGPV